MAIFGKKKEEPIVEIAPTKVETSEADKEEINTVIRSLLSNEEVKIYLAAEEGKILYNLAMKLSKENK